MSETLDHIYDQLRAAGLDVEKLEITGRIERCKVEGDRGASKSGWYALHDYRTAAGAPLIVGSYGNWRTGEKGKISLAGHKALSSEERAALQRRIQADRKRADAFRKARASRASARATAMWHKLPTEGTAPYLERKGVKPYGVRYGTKGTVIVPVRDPAGTIYGLQVIYPSKEAGRREGSDKDFWPFGVQKTGHFHLIGDPEAARQVLVCEGYATGATLHEASELPVVVAFDAGNLRPAAEAFKKRWPKAQLVFCADDDFLTVKPKAAVDNPGVTYANAAALAVGGTVVVPRFAARGDRKLTDFNDLHAEEGLEVVRQQLAEHLQTLQPRAERDLGGQDRSAKGASTPPSGSAGGWDEKSDDQWPGSWRQRLARTQNGALKPDLYNLITILENDPVWKGMFRMNAFANQIYRAREAPYGAGPGEITDVDGTEIAAWLGDPDHYGLSVSSDRVLEAVEAVAMRRRFHPVLEYLEGLTWDGVSRLEHMMPDHFGTVRDEYTAAVGTNWLVSAVARVRRPGCKVDEMVILEGGQGLGKSSAVRTLCGEEWFAEMLESPQNKDFFQNLQGRWIIEIPELGAFNKADRNKIKSAVSAQDDTFRPSYGRYAKKFLRQCIFVGTTNDDTYLKDETGARRFMPVLCTEINLDGLRAQRDQLWAEADALYKAGHPYWKFPEQAAREQEARYDADAWEDPIVQWLDGRAREDSYPPHYGTIVDVDRPVKATITSDVMVHALGIEIGKHSKPDQMRVGAIMRRLGWRRKQQTFNGRVRYVYVRPEREGVRP